MCNWQQSSLVLFLKADVCYCVCVNVYLQDTRIVRLDIYYDATVYYDEIEIGLFC